MSANKRISRRQFLQGAAGVAAFPYIVRSSALGAVGKTSASERIRLGFIGVGQQGRGLLNGVLNETGTQVLAVCDVVQQKLDKAKGIVESCYSARSASGSYKGCAAYWDSKDLLARDDIDAVVIATPDHWHAIGVVEAAKAGKDIYCEKPLSLTISEARAMVTAVRRYNRVMQTGSMQRSNRLFRQACELVRNGYIGEIKKVHVQIGGPPVECYLPADPVPQGLNWDRWLGPAPWRPYNSDIAPPITFTGWANFRAYRDYSGGGMTDWGAHHFDIAQWALGMDASGPVEIIPPDGKDYKNLTYKYANGITMVREDGNDVVFVGTEGKIKVNRSYLYTWPKSLMDQTIGANDVKLYKSDNHLGDWLRCIRTRGKPVCDVEIGCRSATVCHLGNIAYELGRPLRWDPVSERFVGNTEADRKLTRTMRSPWHL